MSLLLDYYDINREKKELEEKLTILKKKIIGQYGEGKHEDSDAKVTIFSKKIRGFSLDTFKKRLKEAGVEHMFKVVNVVQGRLSIEEKELLEDMGSQALELRVTVK